MFCQHAVQRVWSQLFRSSIMLELKTADYHQASCYNFDQPPSGFENGLDNEIEFDPKVHLQLEFPESTRDLKSLGYTDSEIEEFNMVSDIAVTAPFRILSDEGVAALRTTLKRLEKYAFSSPRTPCVLRGGVFLSKFVRDFCMCPEVADHISQIAHHQVVAHPMPSQQGHTNYKPKDASTQVDKWHFDGTPLVVVMFMTDPDTYEGGRFEYFDGTKFEARELFKTTGALPEDRIRRLAHQKPGYAVFQQGPAVFHRATAVTKGDERTTFVQSFVSTNPAHFYGATSVSQSWNGGDPLQLCVPGWIRFRSWYAAQCLGRVLDQSTLAALPASFGEKGENERNVLTATARVTKAIVALDKAVGCPFKDTKPEWLESLDEATQPLTELVASLDETSTPYKHSKQALDMQFLREDVKAFETSTMEYY
eukprot:TRINITY_DN12294_c0_g1_i1.p2 TRINITY_DN12294_c0_g1~~TRINITY_DN12294_c0_g1_i1.p2  ORF type:complete len:423 (+),score=75.30 TRINITY_DN12294_c0_g1_i1:1486-2754(+)